MNAIKKIEIANIRTYLFLTLLCLMTVFQQNLKFLKIILILCLIGFVIYDIYKNNLKLSKYVLICYSSWIFLYFLYFIYSIIRNNPGALSSVKVEVIYAILFLFMTPNINKKEQINYISHALIFINITTIILTSVCLIITILNIDILIPFADYFGFMHGIHGGFLETSTYNVDALFFTIPFTFYQYIVNDNRNKYYSFSFVLSIYFLFISGRAAMQLLIVFSLLMCFLIKKWNILKKVSLKKIGICIFILFILLFILSILTGIDKMIIHTITHPTSIRMKQFYSLMDDFFRHPIFGNGLGFVSKMVRDPAMPWAYELTYVKLLASFGIVGFFVYGIILFMLTINLIKKDKTKEIIPFIFSTIIMLIANFSNPYLTRFDNMWIIFIPLIIFNTLKKEDYLKINFKK